MSCQKESNIDNPVVVTSTPRLGTLWTYRYLIYNQDGSLSSNQTITHKAKSEIMLGGEKWLNIVDVIPDTTVYLLNTKTGGLYQYTNNGSNLLCKFPAALNDTYTTFNEGVLENFTVKSVNEILPTGIGDIPVNYYEGIKNSVLIDLIWYSDKAWIVRKTQYRNRSVITPVFYKYYTFYLDSITY
ncbi:MAG: hypothetical protein IPP48_09795 [Chitinophagaceae bacterium]|nr:hypothetical protein [Chitinophagaceae bacterium]